MGEKRPQRLPKNPQPKEWLAKDHSLQYVADYKPFNFVDGEGVRCSVYVSGCLFNCPGCYNKAAQNFHYGQPYTQELEDQIMEDLSQSYVQGLTLLGGEPFLNTQVCLKLIHRLRKEFGHTKDIWSWSGYTWEELLKDSDDKLEMLNYTNDNVEDPDGDFAKLKDYLATAYGEGKIDDTDTRKRISWENNTLNNGSGYTITLSSYPDRKSISLSILMLS